MDRWEWVGPEGTQNIVTGERVNSEFSISCAAPPPNFSVRKALTYTTATYLTFHNQSTHCCVGLTHKSRDMIVL
ncbi:MAG: hypothetical protein WA952_16360, partial [Lewinella sp.]